MELLYWIWNCKVVLPFCKSRDRKNATRLSLIYVFENGSNINAVFNSIGCKYVKHETLLNMIAQNKNMNQEEQIELLIKYKFDFGKLINVYDNIKQWNGLMALTTFNNSYSSIKLLFDHCKTQKQCNIDITHCDNKGKNALFLTSTTDMKSFSYLLGNVCFPNDDIKNKDGQIAMNEKDKYGATIAHHAANDPTPFTVDIFKLLKKYNFNFNIYDYYGRLPIHVACTRNNHLLLAWMIDHHDNNVFDDDIINVKTNNAINTKHNGNTPLLYAVRYSSFECVDVLCKQENIEITSQDLAKALKKGNDKIVKVLMQRQEQSESQIQIQYKPIL